MDKIIDQKISLKCTPSEAFQLFTQNKHLEKWLLYRYARRKSKTSESKGRLLADDQSGR
jgi:hypothetical protein